jgi:hypothetical protein
MEEFMTMMDEFVTQHYEHLAIPGSGEGEE